MGSFILGSVHHDDVALVSLLLAVIGVGCLLGAAYMAYLRNALACGLLLVVAIFAFYFS